MNIKKVCKFFKVPNKVVTIKSRNIIKTLGDFSQPVSSILEYSYYALAKEAKKNNVEVVLSGEGADEIFFGYDHNLALIGHFNKKFSFLKKKYKFRNKLFKNSSINNFRKVEDLFIFGGADIDLEKSRNKIFHKNISKTKSLKKTVSKLIEKYKLKNPHDVDKISVMLDYHIKVPELFIRRADTPAMNQGVEIRFPYLNKKLQDLMYVTPLEYKIDKTLTQKALLRNVALKIIPKKILFEKMPFGVPGSLSRYFPKSSTIFKKPAFKKLMYININNIKKAVLHGSYKKLNFFKKGFLIDMVNKQKNEKDCFFDNTLWKIWSFAKWYEKNSKKFPN